MVHIPILRQGEAYESVETADIVHHATGVAVAAVSQANSGMVARDVQRMDPDALERFTAAELFEASKRAGTVFMEGMLPLGNATQTFDDYIRQLSATTGMPITYCRDNARKIHRMLTGIDRVIAGLTRGLSPSILDRGYGADGGRMVSFRRTARVFGAVLPSNSPGVHALWIPAVAMKTPVVLKPGREEPWTPCRVIQAFIAAGLPPEAFGFYPTDHGGASELLRCADRSMLFGGGATTRPWADDPRVELHGPGYSKVILGEDAADDWEQVVDLIVESITANGGRSCINASGVWVPRNGQAIAEAVAARLAEVEALPADDPEATIAAFAHPEAAEAMSQSIDRQLGVRGAVDLCERRRGSSRLVRRGRCAWLLPSIIWCEDREHALAHREYLFPFASIVECPVDELPTAIGPTLVVSALTSDEALISALMRAPNVDRLNIGPIPTHRLSWDQPHEGNLFEHLYRRRAFQRERARSQKVKSRKPKAESRKLRT
ncbi:MAG: aldehyde dehydrogenase family protein, partial [Phycisphaerae bacterium]